MVPWDGGKYFAVRPHGRGARGTGWRWSRVMVRPLENSFDPAGSRRRESSERYVPQEHTGVSDNDSAPRDWSQLGRRVLAEAWRRTTDDVAGQVATATPVVPAPRSEEEAE